MAESGQEIMQRILGDEPTWPQSGDGKKVQDPARQIALELARLNAVLVQIGSAVVESMKIEKGRMEIEAELLAFLQKNQEQTVGFALEQGSAYKELMAVLGPFLERALGAKGSPADAESEPALPSRELPHEANVQGARVVAMPPKVKEIEGTVEPEGEDAAS